MAWRASHAIDTSCCFARRCRASYSSGSMLTVNRCFVATCNLLHRAALRSVPSFVQWRQRWFVSRVSGLAKVVLSGLEPSMWPWRGGVQRTSPVRVVRAGMFPVTSRRESQAGLRRHQHATLPLIRPPPRTLKHRDGAGGRGATPRRREDSGPSVFFRGPSHRDQHCSLTCQRARLKIGFDDEVVPIAPVQVAAPRLPRWLRVATCA